MLRPCTETSFFLHDQFVDYVRMQYTYDSKQSGAKNHDVYNHLSNIKAFAELFYHYGKELVEMTGLSFQTYETSLENSIQILKKLGVF